VNRWRPNDHGKEPLTVAAGATGASPPRLRAEPALFAPLPGYGPAGLPVVGNFALGRTIEPAIRVDAPPQPRPVAEVGGCAEVAAEDAGRNGFFFGDDPVGQEGVRARGVQAQRVTVASPEAEIEDGLAASVMDLRGDYLAGIALARHSAHSQDLHYEHLNGLRRTPFLGLAVAFPLLNL
jgi:hypothetical protein